MPDTAGRDPAEPAPARCPVCESSDTRVFFTLSDLPVQDGLLWPTRAEALASPVGEVRLTFCASCGFIWNQAFEPEKLRYERGYDISLHHSPVYRKFIEELAQRLIDTYGLRGKTILEIACGNGEFLKELCRRGDNRGIGFDPSLRLEEASTDGGRLAFVADFYSEKYAGRAADFLCCRHLLQSLPQPRPFLEGLRRTIGTRALPVYLEVPNALRTFHDLVLWYLVYEYCCFFAPVSLARLFEISGFEVLANGPCFGGQYLGIEARVGGTSRTRAPEGDAGLASLGRDVSEFERRAAEKRASWSRKLESLRRSGRRLAAWGAGGRAITFLSLFSGETEISDVVDINPKRQGLYLPRTGQRVVPPESLRDSRPDLILVTNPAFEAEVRQQAGGLGLACEFLVLS